ncbi:hypothetical protein G7046_g245 [Stylonectria norvegica]|nr:hypothetical protein G7046_g245 [Stylonectria norvegica]
MAVSPDCLKGPQSGSQPNIDSPTLGSPTLISPSHQQQEQQASSPPSERSISPFNLATHTPPPSYYEDIQVPQRRYWCPQSPTTCLEAFFGGVDGTYPGLDREELFQILQTHTFAIFRSPMRCFEFKIVWLATAIGACGLEDDEPRSKNIHFLTTYKKILANCIRAPCLHSLQCLALLGVYSLYDPVAFRPRSVIKLLGDMAMQLGLDSLVEDQSQCTLGIRGLFITIFNLDRTIAASMGVPVTMQVEDLSPFLFDPAPDAIMPAENYPSVRNRITFDLQTLEGKIIRQVHHPEYTAIQNLTRADCRAIIADLSLDIDHWSIITRDRLARTLSEVNYTNHLTWITTQYCGLKLLLNYPSKINPVTCPGSRRELLSYAQLYIDCVFARLSDRNLVYFHPGLCRLVLAGMVLIQHLLAAPQWPQSEVQRSRTAANYCAEVMEDNIATSTAGRPFARVLRDMVALANPLAPEPPDMLTGTQRYLCKERYNRHAQNLFGYDSKYVPLRDWDGGVAVAECTRFSDVFKWVISTREFKGLKARMH